MIPHTHSIPDLCGVVGVHGWPAHLYYRFRSKSVIQQPLPANGAYMRLWMYRFTIRASTNFSFLINHPTPQSKIQISFQKCIIYGQKCWECHTKHQDIGKVLVNTVLALGCQLLQRLGCPIPLRTLHCFSHQLLIAAFNIIRSVVTVYI